MTSITLKPRIFWCQKRKLWVCRSPLPHFGVGFGTTPYMAYIDWQYQ